MCWIDEWWAIEKEGKNIIDRPIIGEKIKSFFLLYVIIGWVRLKIYPNEDICAAAATSL
jgi:hypothetical protein